MSAVADVLLGPWGCIALAAGVVIFGSGVFAATSLAGALRDRREDRAWAAEIAQRVRDAEYEARWDDVGSAILDSEGETP